MAGGGGLVHDQEVVPVGGVQRGQEAEEGCGYVSGHFLCIMNVQGTTENGGSLVDRLASHFWCAHTLQRAATVTTHNLKHTAQAIAVLNRKWHSHNLGATF